jgi:TPR repeat protein
MIEFCLLAMSLLSCLLLPLMYSLPGNADAQYTLGLMCKMGDGVPVDLKQSMKYFKMAAQNHPKGSMSC